LDIEGTIGDEDLNIDGRTGDDLELDLKGSVIKGGAIKVPKAEWRRVKVVDRCIIKLWDLSSGGTIDGDGKVEARNGDGVKDGAHVVLLTRGIETAREIKVCRFKRVVAFE